MLSKAALEIVNGIRSGDAIGGPSKMATIVAKSIAQHHQIVPEDLIRRYNDWWSADAFDTGPTFASKMTKLSLISMLNIQESLLLH